MKSHRQRPSLRSGRSAPRGSAAFSLVEIMVTVSLLTVIVLGLLAMFDQTQKAFRGGMTQTDVLESGRSLGDMLSREVAQTTSSGASNTVNLFIGEPAGPFMQGLPGDPRGVRINVTERFYFLTRANQQWTAYDYQVQPEFGAPDFGVGTLYRYVTNVTVPAIPQPARRFNDNLAFNPGGVSRVADGIVHFRVQAYDTNGVLISAPRGGPAWTNVWDRTSGAQTYRFWSNALPASIEVEFAILEPEALARFRTLAGSGSAKKITVLNYLSNQVSRAHLFRQRIPLRNADSGISP
jgi:hypothetical protein